MSLRLDWCSYEAAKYACEKWHYTGKIPVYKLLNVGVWENGTFTGVVIFGLGASAVMHKQFGVSNTEACELVRVALSAHETPVSRILSIALKFLRRKCPGIKVVVSFADPSQGHHGGIYQATNWFYTGMSAETTEYYYNGDWRHVTDVYKRLPGERIKQLPSRKRPGKYRYVYPLTDDMRSKIEPLRKPYPKRASVVHTVEQPAYQQGEGGSIPTLTHT
jgi:hypothetical protein